jgi:hypothetical protein
MGQAGIVRHCWVGGLEEEEDEHIPAAGWAGGTGIGSYYWSVKTLTAASEVLVTVHVAMG